ncbi:serine/threonine-protein kinase-like protein CCR4 [Olea europaea var. sylvestris]|uniref:serine/threonine-protein kinase-like protein CCR4 n=1 Tax=Olea europaea var. sylvestris TaxID=158386 RepID=UPI000C1D5B3D|nr:serine/threonine-protein kinase-like protein CCR4 [Olea europaea var. sylvestris]
MVLVYDNWERLVEATLKRSFGKLLGVLASALLLQIPETITRAKTSFAKHKVSDFGVSLIGPQDDQSHMSLRAADMVGYLDPEYYRLQQLTTKNDIYSFEVVLLELPSGVLDHRVLPRTPFEIEAVAYVGYLAADCVMREGKDRPSMSDMVNCLDRALKACLPPPLVDPKGL